MRFCKNCEHFRAEHGYYSYAELCALSGEGEIDPVNGKQTKWRWNKLCSDMRKSGERCGPDGRLFEQYVPRPGIKRWALMQHLFGSPGERRG